MDYEDLEQKKELTKIMKKSRVKRCLHPNTQECSYRINKAHSIQKNRILSKISEKGKVMVIIHSQQNEDCEPVGKNKATTFSGFCSKHDTCLFSQIENRNYTLGDSEQEFLFAYRAFAKEIIAKEEAKNLYNYLIKEKSSPFSKFLQETEAGLNDLYLLKATFDKAILNKNFDIIETKAIVWDNEYLFAISSMFDLILDFKKNIINDLNDFSKNPKPIYLTIFPQDGKTYVLISYMKEHRTDFNFLNEQILDISLDDQKKRISWIICLYCENFAISPKIWEKFDGTEKRRFIWLFHLTKDRIVGLDNVKEIPFNLFFKQPA